MIGMRRYWNMPLYCRRRRLCWITLCRDTEILKALRPKVRPAYEAAFGGRFNALQKEGRRDDCDKERPRTLYGRRFQVKIVVDHHTFHRPEAVGSGENTASVIR